MHGGRAIRFSKDNRLHRAEEFSAVIRFRCSASGEFLQVFAIPTAFAHARLGMVIPGRVERLSVVRSRVKRLLRETFRARQRELAGLDLVLRLRSRVPRHEMPRMVEEAETLMLRVQRCRG